MAYHGFGNHSGPSGQPRAQTPIATFPRPPPSSPLPISPRSSIDYRDLDASEGIFSPPLDSSRLFPGPHNSLHMPSSNRSHVVPYRARSPPLVYQNNPFVTRQYRHNEEVQQRPFSPGWVNQSKLSSQKTTPAVQEGTSPVLRTNDTYQSESMFQTKHADGALPKRTRSPTFPSTSGFSPENTRSDGHKRSLIHYRDLDAPEDMSSPPLAFESGSTRRESSRPFAGNQKPFPSSSMLADQSKPSVNNTTPPVQGGMSSPLKARGTYQSERKFQTEHADAQLPKRTRSPTNPSASRGFAQSPATVSDSHKRAPGFQMQSQSPTSRQGNTAEASANKPMDYPAVKRTKIPLQSLPNLASQDNLDPAQEIERELHAKAKRLARFKDELSQPVQSHSTVKNQKDPAKSQHISMSEKQKKSEGPKMDMMVDSSGVNVHPDYEVVTSSSCIVGLCPDMCPESERAERERKGDLDQYERLDGDRNMTTEFLAVKKYTRTAEREPDLIRPMPILQKTMNYLLNLLDEPYNDRFLALYNFLWDRMRAIRMDLRMQHIFNLEAISMLEQMIRLHIIAMHELCEYTKGEGFSEGFDAHLNIEQMNKTSVELFQLYDDHRKKGIHVPSEREFIGYYALLKLDKHPGYKVEPAELSLDLAKMTPEMRQTPEVIFARDVARACRTGNFIAFFRLARKASYLQSCLMHAHFSKLRTQALASLHSGLQNNQGIPITHVAKWLGMEEEDIEELLEYYGFSVKDFEEPYMVKENTFVNVDNDFPVKRSKLVERKRSRMITTNVSYPSVSESHTDDGVKEFLLKKDVVPRPAPLQPIVSIRNPQLHDEMMHDLDTSPSPKSSVQKPMHKTSTFPSTPDKRTSGFEVQVAPTGPLVSDFFNLSPQHHQIGIESAQKPKFEPAFRISFGRSKKHESEATGPVTQESAFTQTTAEEERDPVTPLDSDTHTPSPQPLVDGLEDEELAESVEEDIPDEVTSNYDKEVEEAKLRLTLRIWKRRTTKKRILREHKEFAANAALDLLSLGPPMWHNEVQADNFGTFNIDQVMSRRYEIQERSWSVLNPSHVIAPRLGQKNPDAKCLCWKLVLCSEEAVHDDNLSPAASWLYSKLMPGNYDDLDDLVVSSPGLGIWKSWICSQSGPDPTCCLSVIKSMNFKDPNKSLTGANAILFLLSDQIPLHLQKNRLHDLVMSLPSGSCLPLLILNVSCKDECDPSTIAEVLELHDIDKSRVIESCITFLKDFETNKLDGFFSDEHLRDGLEWLARKSPPQIIVTGIKTLERVLAHLNTTLEFLDDMDTHRVDPNVCIAAFNEALDRSIKEIFAAANANSTDWPCPEIDLLEESTDEYRAVIWHLPSIGWSSASRIKVLTTALNESKLPSMEDDLTWLSRGLNIGDDIGEQKSHLENILIRYLTETSRMMGVTMARNEVTICLQTCTSLELRNTTYFITPKWVSIFWRIFNWRLMSLNSREVSSTYLLAQDYLSAPTFEVPFLPPYLAQPSLDELVEVGRRTTDIGSDHMEHGDDQQPSHMASDDADVLASNGNVVPMENEAERISYGRSAAEETNGGAQLTKGRKDADKLSQLLEKCNIVQNLIDEKLSLYF